MNKKQETFVKAYTRLGTDTYQNGTKSAIEAGYSQDTAYSQANRLLKYDEIRKAVDAEMVRNAERLKISEEEIERRIESLSRLSEKDSDKLRALELLAKIKAMFKENQTQTTIYQNFSASKRSKLNQLEKNLLKTEPIKTETVTKLPKKQSLESDRDRNPFGGS